MIYKVPKREAVLVALMERWVLPFNPTTNLSMDVRVAKKGKVRESTFTFPFSPN